MRLRHPTRSLSAIKRSFTRSTHSYQLIISGLKTTTVTINSQFIAQNDVKYMAQIKILVYKNPPTKNDGLTVRFRPIERTNLKNE